MAQEGAEKGSKEEFSEQHRLVFSAVLLEEGVGLYPACLS